MNKFFAGLALTLGLASPAFAGGYEGTHGTEGVVEYHFNTNVITVSCFRGPWEQVIWDRANPVFIDSLIEVGYDYPTAQAIGERVCRDQSLVRNPDGLKNEMVRIYVESPQYRHHG